MDSFKRLAYAAAFLAIGTLSLIYVGAQSPFLIGMIASFLLCFIIAFSKEEKRRIFGLYLMAGLIITAHITGFVYHLNFGYTVPIVFGFGMAIGAAPGALFGWPTNQDSNAN